MSLNNEFDEEEEDEEWDHPKITWTNLIFLPFHPIFRVVVLAASVLKAIMGPISGIAPQFVYCYEESQSFIFTWSTFFYLYFTTPMILVDIILHMVHRQLSDISMKCEHMPKSVLKLMVDAAGVMPWFQLAAVDCPEVVLWPNALLFFDIMMSYRVGEYYRLQRGHATWELTSGFFVLSIITINAVTCVWLLLTAHGMCGRCDRGDIFYDWRRYVRLDRQEKYIGISFDLYGHAVSFISSALLGMVTSDIRTRTNLERFIIDILQLLSYVLLTYVITPRMFCEVVLKLRQISHFQPHVSKVIAETRVRTQDRGTIAAVEAFYQHVWTMRRGTMTEPRLLSELPPDLIIKIKDDLTWPVLFHTSIFRRCSDSFKRYLALRVDFDFKIPGEKILCGNYIHGNLIYLKSGIIQLFSTDDDKTPILSLTSGTTIGDVNFMVPPRRVKISIRCKSYCEFYLIKRKVLISSLHFFPEERVRIIAKVHEKFSHARGLTASKKRCRVTDTTEYEGMAWLKKRWTEIATLSKICKSKDIHLMSVLPHETEKYHCPKHIGEVVLFKNERVLQSTLVRNPHSTLPWILESTSYFVILWEKIVKITVLLVVLTFPPCLKHSDYSQNDAWFGYWNFWVNIIYIIDVFVVLSITKPSDTYTLNIVEVIKTNLESSVFFLNVLSTPIVSYTLRALGVLREHINMSLFCRLIKIYVFYVDIYTEENILKKDLMITGMLKSMFRFFSFVYISAFFIYLVSHDYIPNMDHNYFFCEFNITSTMTIPVAWYSLFFVSFCSTVSMTTVYVKIVLTFMFYCVLIVCKTYAYAVLYYRSKPFMTCQLFINSMIESYNSYQMHPYLINRVIKYSLCYWSMYKDTEFMRTDTMMKEEPYSLYYRVHGQFAENLIMNCKAFRGVDNNLVKDIAYNTTFVMVPKYATLYSCGTECDTAIWIIKGQIKCEYFDRNGVLVSNLYPAGEMLSFGGIFVGKISLRTYRAHTDCETIQINVHVLKGIIENYPQEKKVITSCGTEFAAVYSKMLNNSLRNHYAELKKLKKARVDTVKVTSYQKFMKSVRSVRSVRTLWHPRRIQWRQWRTWPRRLRDNWCRVWINPTQKFMRYWYPFRAATSVVSVFCSTYSGTKGVDVRYILSPIIIICDIIAAADMMIKFLVAYFDNRGLLIYSPTKRILNYVTHSFAFDLLGLAPWPQLMQYSMKTHVNEMADLLWDSYTRCFHLYIFHGYCNYLSDWPKSKGVIILLLKWQVTSILLQLISTQHLMCLCFDVYWDEHLHPYRFDYQDDTCLFHRNLRNDPKGRFFQIFGRASTIAQYNSMLANFGKPINSKTSEHGFFSYVPLFVIDVIYWYINIFSVTIMFLYFRRNSLLKDDISQLIKFLTSERVDDAIKKRVRRHFKYWWVRSKGLQILNPLMTRMGQVIRQDITMNLYKPTLDSFGTIVDCSSHTKRVLASLLEPLYCLPNEDIMREMRMDPLVYIVQRGQVGIYKEGKLITVLTPGAIFGRLSGGGTGVSTGNGAAGEAEREVHGARVGAKARGPADVLTVRRSQLYCVLGEKLKKTIAKLAVNDYIPTKTLRLEAPEQSIPYLTRGLPTIMLPRSSRAWSMKESALLWWWLQLAWLAEPTAGALVALPLQLAAPPECHRHCEGVAIACDIVFAFNLMLFFFFSVRMQVYGSQLTYSRARRIKLRELGLYFDVLSLILVILRPVTELRFFHLARLMRLRYLWKYRKHFCRSFRNPYRSAALYTCSLLICLTIMICLQLYYTCQDVITGYTKYPEEELYLLVDKDEFTIANVRKEGGCLWVVWYKDEWLYFRPKTWYSDFFWVTSNILQYNFNYYELNVEFLTIRSWWHFYTEKVVRMVLLIIHYFVSAKALEILYLRYRKILKFDYYVRNLLTFLRFQGITKGLAVYLENYCSRLWTRNGGNLLPELVTRAPACLKEDIMCALYVHHLALQPLFQPIPDYFLRQLATAFHRRVVFAGNDILECGDILGRVYFIHDGEVEKYYVDKDGNKRMATVLTNNGYFGFISSIFPSIPHQCTYISRTVVDLVYLEHKDWTTLMDEYPDVKELILDIARGLIKDKWAT